MPRYKITIEYDGTGLSGWQKQKTHVTVQQLLEESILRFSQENVQTTAAGRTDAGVHARGQVVHFDLNSNFQPHQVCMGLNFHMKDTRISVLDAKIVDSFNARFDAEKRFYRYIIINRAASLALEKNRAWQIAKPLDIKAMQKAAEYLIGKHDFTSFRATACQSKSPIKTMDKILITKDNDTIYFDFEAKSFLHHMIRNIIGTLATVGSGVLQPEDVKEILNAKNRRMAGKTAPASGLYFIKVDY